MQLIRGAAFKLIKQQIHANVKSTFSLSASHFVRIEGCVECVLCRSLQAMLILSSRAYPKTQRLSEIDPLR